MLYKQIIGVPSITQVSHFNLGIELQSIIELLEATFAILLVIHNILLLTV